MQQIRCIECGNIHKATSEKFPIARKGRRFDTKKNEWVVDILGYICKWCIKKHIRREEIKNAIEQQNQSNQSKTTQKEQPPMAQQSKSQSKNMEIKKQGILSKIFQKFTQRNKI